MKINITTKQTAALVAVILGTTGMGALADQATSAAGTERSYTGTVTSCDAQNRMMKVKSWMLLKKQFSLGDNCAYVMLDNPRGSAGDLRPGEKVTVHYQTSHGVRIADRIEQRPMQFEGTVGLIDLDKHQLIVHQPGLDKPLVIAAGCNVILRKDRAGSLADIKPGDHVLVTYELPDGDPTARRIAQTSSEFVGRLTAINLDNQTLRARDTFADKKFNLADNCVIVVNGKMDGKLGELKPNERLVFDYDSINGVNVVNRIAPAPPEAQTNSMYTTVPGYPDYPGGY